MNLFSYVRTHCGRAVESFAQFPLRNMHLNLNLKRQNTRGLHNYVSGHCEERSNAAIYYNYMDIEIASYSFAMTLYGYYANVS